jgi:hypothetical protein
MNNRRESVPFRVRIARTLALPCVTVRHEIPDTSENCHLTSFRTYLPVDSDNGTEVKLVYLITVFPYF